MPMLVVNSDPERLWGKPLGPTREELKQMYFTLESLEDCVHTFTEIGSTSTKKPYYSLDNGETWTLAVKDAPIETSAGDKILLKGTNTYYATNISSTGDFICYGNLLSMKYGDDFSEETEGWEFSKFFANNSHLISAANLIMPESGGNYGGGSYPVATNSFFKNCTSLTTAPELPATTLTEKCYSGLFYGCTSLNYIKMLATDISAEGCLLYWTNNVAATGTFVKAAGVEIPTGTSGIPEGWTVEEV